MSLVTFFRCDASPSIGAGHVVRCMALAEAIVATGGKAVFAIREPTRNLVPGLASYETIELSGPIVDEADEIGSVARGVGAALVVDHYQRDAVFERRCRHWARSILVLDDLTGRQHDCDVLVDAGVASPSVYCDFVPQHASILVGPSFAPLRGAFQLHRDAALVRRDGRPVAKVLVSFGATDVSNVIPVTLDVLDEVLPETMILVAISAHAPHIESIRKRAGGRIQLLVDVADMAELMADADLAIGAAGNSAYERACLGLPTVAIIVAENQRSIADNLKTSGAATVLDQARFDLRSALGEAVTRLVRNDSERADMARRAAGLIDGLGAQRALERFREMAA